MVVGETLIPVQFSCRYLPCSQIESSLFTMLALVRALSSLISISTIRLTLRTPDCVRKVINMKINKQFIKFGVQIGLVFISMRIFNCNSGVFLLKKILSLVRQAEEIENDKMISYFVLHL